jgi:hypothetical protein
LTQLFESDAGRAFDVEQRQSEVDQLKPQSALANSPPAGSTGMAAIFTDRVRAANVIRKVLLRQIAITNCVNPF